MKCIFNMQFASWLLLVCSMVAYALYDSDYALCLCLGMLIERIYSLRQVGDA